MAKAQKVTRQDVDAFAILSEKKKSIEADLKRRQEALRAVLAPGESLVGYAYSVGLSEVPMLQQKPDYREELIRAIGLQRVEALDAKYAEKTPSTGTPKILIRPNADASVKEIQMGAKIHAALSAGGRESEVLRVIRMVGKKAVRS